MLIFTALQDNKLEKYGRRPQLLFKWKIVKDKLNLFQMEYNPNICCEFNTTSKKLKIKISFPDTGKAHVRPQTPHTDVNRTHSRTYWFIYID